MKYYSSEIFQYKKSIRYAEKIVNKKITNNESLNFTKTYEFPITNKQPHSKVSNSL